MRVVFQILGFQRLKRVSKAGAQGMTKGALAAASAEEHGLKIERMDGKQSHDWHSQIWAPIYLITKI